MVNLSATKAKQQGYHIGLGGSVLQLLRRTRNTSLILPAVIEKTAQLKGISAEEVEQAVAINTIRLFDLSIPKEAP